MVSAYATIENDGYYREPTCIVRITDAKGNELIGDDIVSIQIYKTDARTMTEALIGL